MINPCEIHNADCVEAVKRLHTPMQLDRPRLIFADPPYNIGVHYGPGAPSDDRDADLYVKWTACWISACAEWLDDGGAMWVLAPEEWVEAIMDSMALARLVRRRMVVWHETFGVHCAANFGRCARFLLYYIKHAKGGTPFTWNPDPVMVESARQRARDKRARGPKIMDNVWTVPRVCGSHAEKVKGMPNQLPIELVRRAVLSTSNPGDIVVDPFCGTGTTGVVCAMRGRRFIGIDASACACAVSAERIGRYTETPPNIIKGTNGV